MKHMLCFDNPTQLRTVFSNLKASDKLWFSLNSVCAIFSVYVQTKELLFQECMAWIEGLESGKKLSSAWLPILNLGCAQLLTQNMMAPELAESKRHAQELCVKAQDSPSERNSMFSSHAEPHSKPQIRTVFIKPAR